MLSELDDAVRLAERVRLGEMSEREVVQAAIARIERLNPDLNAVVHTRFDDAMDEVARGLPDGPLRGVPVLVKDLGADVAGSPSTGGSRLFAGIRAGADSALVARYRKAGMVVLGTTNTPELGKNASTEPVLYGAARNPWQLTHTPGGSSGGSAAAVAAGMVAVAHGNDGGGSIRIPASMCGLFGLKPTRGRVPGAPYADSLANPLTVQHALTSTVRDSALLLDVSAGAVPGDAYAAPAQVRPFTDEAATPPGTLRLAVTMSAPDGTVADAQCAKAVEQAAGLCEELGHEVHEAHPDYDVPAAASASGTLMTAHLAATVDRRLAELGRKLCEDDLEPFSHAMLERARSLGAAAVIDALQVSQRTSWELGRFFGHYDALLTPTVAQPVPPLGTLDTTRVEEMYRLGSTFSACTGVFNLTGQPAMSIPCGLDSGGLPIGVQFASGLGGEGLLLRLAAQLEEAAPWPRTAPAYGPRPPSATTS